MECDRAIANVGRCRGCSIHAQMYERVNQCVGSLPFGSRGSDAMMASSSNAVWAGRSAAGIASSPPAINSLGIYMHVHSNMIMEQ